MLEHARYSLLSGGSVCSPSSTEGSTGLLVGEREEPVLALLPVGEGGRGGRRGREERGREREKCGFSMCFTHRHTHTHTRT